MTSRACSVRISFYFVWLYHISVSVSACSSSILKLYEGNTGWNIWLVFNTLSRCLEQHLPKFDLRYLVTLETVGSARGFESVGRGKKIGCTARVVGLKGPSTNFMHEVQFTHRDESLLTLWQRLYDVFCGFGGELSEVSVKWPCWGHRGCEGSGFERLTSLTESMCSEKSVRVEWDTIKLHYGNRRLIFGAWPILGTKSQAISPSAAMILTLCFTICLFRDTTT